MAEQAGDKTQEATPHRREQAREEGQVARSQDLGSAALLIGGLLVLVMLGGPLVDYFADYTRRQLGGEAWLSADIDFVHSQWGKMTSELARAVFPVLGLLLCIGIATQVLQFGFLFLPEKLAPDLSRIDPWAGLTRLFSLPSTVRLGFGLFKVLVVGGAAFASLQSDLPRIQGLASLSLDQIAVSMWDLLFWTTMRIALALLVLAIADYAFQWWKHEQDLRMTPQEVREEMKNLQGDPQIIARRRAVQRQLVLNRLKSSVPKADVVITNPTELAIALQYDPESMPAPVMLAKGAGVLAQRIRQLALEHGIPIVEKKPLARALYRDVEVGQSIPHQMYSAVAEVLAYVYQLKGKKAPSGLSSSA